LTKLAPSYLRYPTVKREEGDVGGHLQKIVTEGWRLSSDVGCAFILLDGITHTYEITGNKALLPVIRAMISKFSQIDYVRYNCQTHATLSGSRGGSSLLSVDGRARAFGPGETQFRAVLQLRNDA